jgi:hypothetical protein
MDSDRGVTMSDSQGFGVHYPTGETARRALLDTHADLTATVRNTQDGNTALADAIPALKTSQKLNELQAKYGKKVNDHAQVLAGNAIMLQLSFDNYRHADSASEGSIDRIAVEA